MKAQRPPYVAEWSCAEGAATLRVSKGVSARHQKHSTRRRKLILGEVRIECGTPCEVCARAPWKRV